MPVHDVAAAGFGSEAAAYERGRPSYPDDVVAWLVDVLAITGGTRVLDLAAGTGKLTRLLAPAGAWLAAVEPVAGMREGLRTRPTPDAIIAGTAEALPFATATVDAVTVAQAFHWFDAEAAFTELARVVRPGGRVALLWNARDKRVDWVRQIWDVMNRVERHAPWRQHETWQESSLGARAGFGPLHTATFHHEQVVTRAGLRDRFRSVSHIAVLPPDEQQAVLDEVEHVVATHPDTRDLDQYAIPYRVDAYWCERVA